VTTENDKDKEQTEAPKPAKARSTKKDAAKPKPKPKPKAGTAAKSKAKPKTARAPRGKAKAAASATDDAPAIAAEPLAVPRLLTRYRDEVMGTLTKEFEYGTPMQVPRLTKILLNIGIGAEAILNSKAVESASHDLTLISGQHPITTRARKSIAAFKVREGMPMGLTVTLRNRRMYEFFDRLVSSALPRIRDFRGVSRDSFDGRGNYALGLREQVIFPEIDYNLVDRIRGLQVVVVTSANTDREGIRLLELLGVPFARTEEELAVA
jgi:large subunit ribosomal protein L5